MRQAVHVEKENEALKTQLALLHSELAHKQTFVGRLEYLLHQRTEMIDALHGRIDQLRTANQRLEQEAEHYATLLAASQPDAAMLVPK
jgi:hypothetical protein